MVIRRILGWLLVVLLIGVPTGYFAIGAAASYRVDDSLHIDDMPHEGTDGSDAPTISHVAHTLEALATRELDTNGWQPNNPWFYPTLLTDDGKNFQLGVLHGLRRVLFEYANRAVRQRLNGAPDPDLQAAIGYFQYPPNIWFLDATQGFSSSSESQYRAGRDSLRAYNTKFDGGKNFQELRADNLKRLIETIALDMDVHLAAIQSHASQGYGIFNAKSDDLFYQTKGAVYTYALIIPAIHADFKRIVADKRLTDLWAQLETSLNRAATFKPWVIVTAAPDSPFLTNHLLLQGYFMSQCTDALRRIDEALRN